MLMALMICNLAALGFSLLLLMSVDSQTRWRFLGYAFVTLLIGSVVFWFTEPANERFDPREWLGFFFRGWFILAVVCAALMCYISNHRPDNPS